MLILLQQWGQTKETLEMMRSLIFPCVEMWCKWVHVGSCSSERGTHNSQNIGIGWNRLGNSQGQGLLRVYCEFTVRSDEICSGQAMSLGLSLRIWRCHWRADSRHSCRSENTGTWWEDDWNDYVNYVDEKKNTWLWTKCTKCAKCTTCTKR
jgi:hypothetical protein